MYETLSPQEVCSRLQGDLREGLTREEAARRCRENGKNELKEKRRRTAVEAFFLQLNDPLIYVLLAAAGISVFLGEISDAVIIGAVVTMNALVGVIQEGKAQKALDSLKKLVSPRARVIREGVLQEVEASELAAGDLVCLEAGCQVPADLRLIQAASLKVEESALTGESVPSEKDASFLARCELPLGDRKNMAYMSTVVTCGRGMGIVTATGMDTQIGRIAALISESREEPTPLQKRLGELGTVLSLLSLLLCALLFGIAIVQKRDVFEMLLTAISLAVAAVPEGLPAVVTICLALSVTRMVRVGTIVRRLPCVETLGAVSLVCSDKTGTLTQNRMRVESCFYDQCLVPREAVCARDQGVLLEGMALCNDAVLGREGEEDVGDPTELALLELGRDCGLERPALERELPRIGELPFDSDRKMMSTFHRRGGRGLTYTKGAPDEILGRCSRVLWHGAAVPMTPGRLAQIRGGAAKMSSDALRVLALAMGEGGDGPREKDLIFVGMAGMRDPARPEAAGAVARFREAGVETVMITGDHVDTAFAIGRQLGIAGRRSQCMTGEELGRLPQEEFTRRLKDTRVFARVAPEQKVKIVAGFKALGHIVAMTGDGVNDAPSLKAADIGIAMGKGGTDVARQASDMILTDDNFATIEKAIEEGRGVYENIRKSVIFLLSSNLGEILTMFLAVVWGLASPLRSSHILWINLITDSLPALALGVDKNDTDSLMREKPRRPGESLFSRGGLACTCFYGCLIAAVSLAAFFLAPYAFLQRNRMALSPESLKLALSDPGLLARAQTYAFTVLGISQLFHAVGMRDVNRSVFRMRHLENKAMLAALAVGFALQISVTEVPLLIGAFGTVPLPLSQWALLTGLAAFPLAAHELSVCLSWIARRFSRSAGERRPRSAGEGRTRPAKGGCLPERDVLNWP